MDPIRLGLLAAGGAAATAAVALLLTRRVTGKREAGTPIGPALAAGFAAGFLLVEGLPKSLPREAHQWLLPASLVGSAAGLFEGRREPPHPLLRWAVRLPLAAGLVWVTLLDRSGARAVVPAVVLLLTLAILDGAARRGGPTFLLALGVACAATAVCLGISGSMTFGQHGGAIAAATGACFLLGPWIPVDPRSGVLVAGLVLAGLRLNARIYVDPPLPLASALLLAAAPLGALFPNSWLGEKPRAWVALLARTAAVAAIAGVAVGIAIHESPPTDGW